MKVGDRVVVPFNISCGTCFFCEKELYSCCDTTNRDAEKAAKLMGHAPAGLFGYSHLTGHYPGGQAEYLRVPYADVSPLKIENDSLSDEQVLFLSDIIPTGNKGLTLKTGQTHMKRYTRPLLEKIEAGEIDPSLIITHNRRLAEGLKLYKTFRDKEDGCIKVVLKP